jgi:putative ABC transport system substrate-binding protein
MIDPIIIHSVAELEAAFQTMGTDRPDAAIVQPSLPTKRAAELAIRYRIPAVSIIRGFATDGGLMAYQSKEIDLYRQSASYVDKIPKGAKPADLPIQQPTKFELIINMRTANAIGLTIPPLNANSGQWRAVEIAGSADAVPAIAIASCHPRALGEAAAAWHPPTRREPAG